MTQNTITAYPHITAFKAAQKNKRFLSVLEESDGKKVYNQPAYRLEPNKTPEQATISETGWRFQPKQISWIILRAFKVLNIGCIRRALIVPPLNLPGISHYFSGRYVKCSFITNPLDAIMPGTDVNYRHKL